MVDIANNQIKTKRRTRRARFSPQIEDEIRAHYDIGGTAKDAASQISLKYGDEAPNVRTIQKRFKELRKMETEDSGRWSVADSPSDMAKLVLPALDAVITKTDGRRYFLTINEAKWIAKLCTIAPDLPPWTAYRLARLYILYTYRGDTGASTSDLDMYLAYAPWQGDEQAVAYIDAVTSTKGKVNTVTL